MEGPKRGVPGTPPLDLDTTPPTSRPAVARARAEPKIAPALPEVPDLVLDVPPAPRASGVAPATRVSAAPAPPAGPDLDVPAAPSIARSLAAQGARTSLDDDEELLGAGAGVSLDLDLGVDRPPASGPAPAIPPPAGSGRAPSPQEASGRSLSPSPPSDRSLPESSAPPTDRAAVAALAGFGEVPSKAPWLAPLYAYRVWVRRAELERELVRRRDQARLARSQAEEELLGFAARVRPRAEGVAASFAPIAAALDVLHRAETSLRASDPTTAAALDEHAQAASARAARAAGLAQALEAALAAEREAEALVAPHREARARVDERQRRIEDDIRGAMAQLGQEDDPGRRAQLEAQIARAAAERDRVGLELRASALLAEEARLGEARATVAALRAEREALARDEQVAAESLLRRLGLRGGPMDDARRALREALVALGAAVVGEPAALGDPVSRDPAAKTLAHVRKLEEAVVLHERAREAYDKPTVMLGLGIAAGVVALLVLLLLFPFIYRALVR
jgi:hypothetical protein